MNHECVNCGGTFHESDMFYNDKATLILPDVGWLCKDADKCVDRADGKLEAETQEA